jgi:hypothetical protein
MTDAEKSWAVDVVQEGFQENFNALFGTVSSQYTDDTLTMSKINLGLAQLFAVRALFCRAMGIEPTDLPKIYYDRFPTISAPPSAGATPAGSP